MDDQPQYERPWTEREWERFMLESDVRSAKFGELLETLIDHPDRDEIIAREMGWDREEAGDAVDFDPSDSFDINAALEEALTDEDLEQEMREDKAALQAIPAYSRGYAWGLQVHRTLKPFLESEDADPQDDLVEAFGGSLTVAARIAGGHGMGYDDESICGNIVCCRQALEAARNSAAALESLARQGVLPPETAHPLIEEGREVARLVEERIEELRSCVWWE